MDVQIVLIAALIVHKDKEPAEATKRVHPLADKVYLKVLLEKYKCPAFTKFNGDGNPFDYITIFKIDVARLQQIESQSCNNALSLYGNSLRWFNNCSPSLISSWKELVEQFTVHF